MSVMDKNSQNSTRTDVYRPEDLARVQEIETQIYQAFAAICEKYGLRYYAAYGTALGAARHAGFIPWDDDMDVCMPRKDYEFFRREASKELPPCLQILSVETTEGYVLPFMKISDSRTTFVEKTDMDRRYHSGIFIDILPLDAMAPTTAEQKKQEDRCCLLARLIVLTEYGRVKLPKSMNRAARLFMRAGTLFAHGFFRLFHIRSALIYRKYIAAATRYEQENPKGYSVFGFYGFKPKYLTGDMLFPTQEVPFGKITVRVPNKLDAYLQKNYGDWRVLPPLEERVNHYPAELKFPEDDRKKAEGTE